MNLLFSLKNKIFTYFYGSSSQTENINNILDQDKLFTIAAELEVNSKSFRLESKKSNKK